MIYKKSLKEHPNFIFSDDSVSDDIEVLSMNAIKDAIFKQYSESIEIERGYTRRSIDKENFDLMFDAFFKPIIDKLSLELWAAEHWDIYNR